MSRTRWTTSLSAACLGLACAVVMGCGGDSTTAPTCSASDKLGGACTGVPNEPICSDDPCTDGLKCANVVSVSSDAELTSAIKSAHSGTCIALAAGTYTSAKLPGGVSLLGRSATDVHVGTVSLGAGQNATVRGVGIGAGGLDVGSAQGFLVDAVEVTSAKGDGIHVATGSSGTISRSAVNGSGRYGVEIVDASSVDLTTTVITNSTGPGVRAECTGGCSCSGSVKLSVSSTSITKSGLVGVSLIGVDATLGSVDVTDNAVGENFMPSGGIFASECSKLVATGVNVLDNSSFGVLVDHSTATLGKAGDTTGIEVSRNLIGIWIQKTTADEPVDIANCTLESNSGVGIGLDGAAHGIIIHDSHVSNTKLQALPAITSDGMPLGSKSIGDGLNWLGGSSVSIDGLTLSGNARASMLIDGAVGAGSSMTNVTLSGGDQQKGVIEQNFPSGGRAPTEGSGAPAVQKSAGQTFDIPAPPAAPATL